MAEKKQARTKRIETANEIIRIIASHGRNFLCNHSDGAAYGEPLRYAEFFDSATTGRLRYRDRGRRFSIVDVCSRGEWRGFCDGGTLRDVIERLRDYIISGKLERLVYVRNYWGYGGDADVANNKLEALYIREGLSQATPGTSEAMGVERE